MAMMEPELQDSPGATLEPHVRGFMVTREEPELQEPPGNHISGGFWGSHDGPRTAGPLRSHLGATSQGGLWCPGWTQSCRNLLVPPWSHILRGLLSLGPLLHPAGSLLGPVGWPGAGPGAVGAGGDLGDRFLRSSWGLSSCPLWPPLPPLRCCPLPGHWHHCPGGLLLLPTHPPPPRESLGWGRMGTTSWWPWRSSEECSADTTLRAAGLGASWSHISRGFVEVMVDPEVQEASGATLEPHLKRG